MSLSASLCVCFFAWNVPIGREPTNRDAEFFGAVKGSIPIGREVGPSYWSGERSVPIGRAPTNRDAEFLWAVRSCILIGQAADRRSAPIGRGNGVF